MKTKLNLCLISALCLSALTLQAARSERVLTIAFSGFYQGTNRFGDDLAIPFRSTTKDFLDEISFTTGQNFKGGALLMVESLDDTNAPTQIVARKGTNELEVSEFFQFTKNDNFVFTETFFRGATSSQTFYAIDNFFFSTLAADPEGLEVTFKSFSQDTSRFFATRIGGQLYNVVSTSLRTDGVGELSSGGSFTGPIRGYNSIGAPKFYP